MVDHTVDGVVIGHAVDGVVIGHAVACEGQRQAEACPFTFLVLVS